jgi:1,4-alpha-glucan branching enzyme
VDADLLKRRTTHFTLWAPQQTAPELVVGTFQFGAPPLHVGRQKLALKAVAGVNDLWEIAAANCGLKEGTVYHYWFEVNDTRPGSNPQSRVLVTDPLTFTPDWRLQETDDEQPASVVLFEDGRLVACDQDGAPVTAPATDNPGQLAPNNFTIIYELPTAWMRRPRGGAERGVGSFQDIAAMLDPNLTPPNFDELEASQKGHAHIAELGINAIELLPPADSYYERQWGYGTSHMYAPDTQLGQPDYYSWATANGDLRRLSELCHRLNIRLIADVVMAFARSGTYERASYDSFHIDADKAPDSDPDKWNSRQGNDRKPRMNFGSTLWRFVKQTTTYDPISGVNDTFAPARNLHLVAQERWITDFHIDGFRIDSVENVANWDFLEAFMKNARTRFRNRCAGLGLSQNNADARFLVVGEELNLPLDILRQHRITALWNDRFRELLRCAVLGSAAENESFESTVMKMVDCTRLGFCDMAQAVIYIGSHDVEGVHKERIATTFRYKFLKVADANQLENANNEIGKRVKLAFACLLTAVGIPMILAGDEFAAENDLFDIHGNVTNDSGKQMDPVDFTRLADAWRQDVLSCVKNLIQMRKTHPALGVNDTKWLHHDPTPGREIYAWQRGSDDNPVVVVANFSDFGTADPFNPSSEYVVPNWPRPNDFTWKEVCLNRVIGAGRIGREPLFPWEAKVYVHR